MNSGAELILQNSSQLMIAPEANLVIESNGLLELRGQGTELVLDGKLTTTGDLTIACNGKITIGTC